MNKYVKGAMVFVGGMIGGFVLCGTITINAALKSDDFREFITRKISDKISDKISKWLWGESSEHGTDVKQAKNRRTDIIYESLGSANEVLHNMMDIIDKYGYVTVADMLDLSGKPCSYIDNRYGWVDLRAASIVSTRDGYIIDLPIALPIA